MSLRFVPKGLNNDIPSLVQIMAWRRPGDKPLSEPMIVSLVTHIYIYVYIYIIRHSASLSELEFCPFSKGCYKITYSQIFQSFDIARDRPGLLLASVKLRNCI